MNEIKNYISSTKLMQLNDLQPLQGNLKKLSDENFKKLKKSLLDNGFRFALHAWQDKDGTSYLLDGHQRLSVLSRLQSEGYTIPLLTVNFVDASSKIEAKKLILQAVSQYGKIDNDGFLEFATSIDMTNFDDFDFPDFQLPDLSNLDQKENTNDPDEIPEIEENIYEVHEGQIWQLGKHKLLCGDSTSNANAKLLLAGQKPDFIFTDPPYELDANSVISSLINSTAKHYVLICTFKQAAEIYKLDCFDFRFDFVINAHIPKSFMNHKQPYYTHQTGVYFSAKNTDTIFDCKNTIGIRSENAYWHTIIDSPRSTQDGHGHAKNIKGMIDTMSGFSGSLVYEPFCGSGSTLIACEQSQRACYAIELDPNFCSLTIARWENYTGKKAKLINNL